MTFSQVHNSADLMKKLPNPTLKRLLFIKLIKNESCILKLHML